MPPESVDIVFNPHLHCDHAGWNTHQIEGRWTPTFPNATYLFARREFERWSPDAPPHENDYNESVFAESVAPVVAAGQALIFNGTQAVSPSLRVEPAVGPTDGHSLLRLELAGTTAYFTGDC